VEQQDIELHSRHFFKSPLPPQIAQVSIGAILKIFYWLEMPCVKILSICLLLACIMITPAQNNTCLAQYIYTYKHACAIGFPELNRTRPFTELGYNQTLVLEATLDAQYLYDLGNNTLEDSPICKKTYMAYKCSVVSSCLRSTIIKPCWSTCSDYLLGCTNFQTWEILKICDSQSGEGKPFTVRSDTYCERADSTNSASSLVFHLIFIFLLLFWV
jgi:hypothetical protein